MLRPALSLFGLLVACAGLGLFVAIGVYSWTLKAEVNRQTAVLAERANTAGDAADHAVRFVGEVIDQADKDLAGARSRAGDPPRRPINPFVQVAARQASQDLAGSVERAHVAVVTASDAVKVAQSALKVFEDSDEIKHLFNVHPEQMDATRSTLGNVAGELRQAQTVIGTVPGADDPTPEQLNAVGSALEQARTFTDELAKVVTTARSRVNDVKTTVDRWTLRVALATTLVCALAAVGQVFLARFCWRRYRGLPA